MIKKLFSIPVNFAARTLILPLVMSSPCRDFNFQHFQRQESITDITVYLFPVCPFVPAQAWIMSDVYFQENGFLFWNFVFSTCHLLKIVIWLEESDHSSARFCCIENAGGWMVKCNIWFQCYLFLLRVIFRKFAIFYVCSGHTPQS